MKPGLEIVHEWLSLSHLSSLFTVGDKDEHTTGFLLIILLLNLISLHCTAYDQRRDDRLLVHVTNKNHLARSHGFAVPDVAA